MNPDLLIKKNPDWIAVNVLPEEEKKIDSLGIQRNENGKKLGWVSTTPDDSDKWDMEGMRGEWAASLVYNLPIGRITSKKKSELNSGDLSDWIEVKASSQMDERKWDMIENVRALKPERSYIGSITCFWPKWVIIIGWAWGHEIADGRAITGRKGQPILVLDRSKLRTPFSLFDEIRKKENKCLQTDCHSLDSGLRL